MVGRWMRWWNGWLADDTVLTAPGPIETRYRSVAAAIGRHATAADTTLALAFGTCTLPQLLYWARHQPFGLFLKVLVFTVLLVVPLIWRRRFPLSTFAFLALVALAQWIADVRVAADITLLLALYTVASRYPLRVAVLVTAVLETGTLMAAFRWQQIDNVAGTFVLLSGLVFAALLLGLNVRHRRLSLGALTERAEQLERERDQQATIAAAAERTRIAREMHDVIAHSLSIMVTLSEGAALKQTGEPERAALAMRQVSATGHQALDEMRRLLGVLRTEEEPDGRRPQPGLSRLDELFDQVRATGLSAELAVTGTPTVLSPGAQLTVYRIVQEALTNTLKHALGPTRIRVAIGYAPEAVTVDIHDDGARPDGDPQAGKLGHGLTGMRERAAVYDGVVSAGPDPTGGWRVHAHLPLTAVDRHRP